MAGEFSEKRLDSLDQIRALAILGVVISHRNSGWLPGGGIGVGVFFALSGFLIANILLRDGNSIVGAVKFLIRRFFRVYPLILFTLGVVAVSLPIQWPEKAGDFFAFLPSIALMLDTTYHFGTSINVMWTLIIELSYYVVAPIACLIFGPRVGLLFLSVGLIVSGFYFPQTFFRLYWMGAIGLGSLLAVALPYIKETPPSAVWLAVFAASLGGIFTLLFFQPHPYEVWHMQVYLASLCSCGLIWCSQTKADMPIIPGAAYIGRISYSMYLVHAVLMDYRYLYFDGAELGSWRFYVVTILISSITYRLIEQPGIRFGRWLCKALLDKSSITATQTAS